MDQTIECTSSEFIDLTDEDNPMSSGCDNVKTYTSFTLEECLQATCFVHANAFNYIQVSL